MRVVPLSDIGVRVNATTHYTAARNNSPNSRSNAFATWPIFPEVGEDFCVCVCVGLPLRFLPLLH